MVLRSAPSLVMPVKSFSTPGEPRRSRALARSPKNASHMALRTLPVCAFRISAGRPVPRLRVTICATLLGANTCSPLPAKLPATGASVWRIFAALSHGANRLFQKIARQVRSAENHLIVAEKIASLAAVRSRARYPTTRSATSVGQDVMGAASRCLDYSDDAQRPGCLGLSGSCRNLGCGNPLH